jgi:twitching motility protein PilT
MTDQPTTTLPEDAPPAEHVVESRSLADTPLRRYFDAAVKFEASDLIMRGGQVPKLRLRGALESLKVEPLDPVEFEKHIEAALSAPRWAYYSKHGSIDIADDFVMKDGASHRFRINIFRTRGRSALAARRVNNKILNFEELFLPPSLAKIAEVQQGLVIVCGVTGSGKSTTLASMIQFINDRRPCHILTIEDPIEYLFADGKALVNQREVGIDVPTFEEGLKMMVRENPDVILVGEMRDRLSLEAALRAAETGHLVFCTLHASSTSQAFGRMYDLFPQDERELIRNLLGFQLQAIVCQKLLPTTREDLPRVPAVEVLLQCAPTRKYILEARESELDQVIKNEREAGMQTFTDSLVELVEKNLVHPKVAQAAANSPEEVRMRLRGIST